MRFGEEVTLVVLAGGAGSRLGGVHKPLLEWNGRPLIAHLLDRVGPEVAQTVIVTRTPHLYGGFGARVVTDEVPEGGPLAGLHAALGACRTEWLALVGGDMPRVRIEAFTLLADALRLEDEWAAYERDGRLEPLPALYRRSLLARVPALLERGAGLQSLLRETAGRKIAVEVLVKVDPALESLEGVNTPEEAARLHLVLPRPVS